MKKYYIGMLITLALLLAACGGSSSTPVSAQVNGFGTKENHVHSHIVLPDANHTLVMATHYGIFRSQDHGATWQQTAAGNNQLMQGLMTFSLSYNPRDPQRLYVLTQVVVVPHTGTLGLYTSGDGGKTWQLAISNATIPSGSIYFAQAGNASSSEVYIYVTALGPKGLMVSEDNGKHFTQAGSPLPFGNLLGLLPMPEQPGHFLAYGNQGIASTSDSGKTWQTLSSVQGSIFEITTPGPGKPIYAEGDAGVYASSDNGKSFKLVYTQHSFASLTVSPEQPQIIYGKLSQGIYRSSDGGKSWDILPTLHLSTLALTGDVLVADPDVANQVYLAISYPTEVYHFQSANNAWKSITPPA